MALWLGMLGLACAAGGPERASEPRPVLVELGGWQIFAHAVIRHGSELRFEGVQASRRALRGGESARWQMAADQVHVGLSVARGEQIGWLWARGKVRLSGPDDLYVMADEMMSVSPSRRLVFLTGDEPAASAVGVQQLTAARITVDLMTQNQSLDELTRSVHPWRWDSEHN